MQPVILTVRQIDLTDTRYDIFINQAAAEDHPDIIDSLIFQQAGDKYRLIDGFEILSKETSGDFAVPAYCVPAGEPPLMVLKILLKNRLRKRPFLPIEIARIFRLARDTAITEATIIAQILPLLQLVPKPGIVQQYLTLLTVDVDVVDYLIMKNATFKTWQEITRYSEKERDFILDLIRLQPTLSVLEEVVCFLYEIQKRDGITQEELLNQLGWNDFFGKSSIPARERLRQLRARIYAKRFPQVTACKERIDRMIDILSLPGNAEMKYDETFEKKVLNLNWHFASQKDIDNMENFYTEANISKTREILEKL